MQFNEDTLKKSSKCPVCGNEVPARTTRGPMNYCSRVCKSQSRYATRYRGTMSGPMERPTLREKTKAI